MDKEVYRKYLAQQIMSASPAKLVSMLYERAITLLHQTVEAIEAGEFEPTRPMLVKMAAKYRRPLIAFYMAKPPQPSNKGQDFRTRRAEGPAGVPAISTEATSSSSDLNSDGRA